MKDCEDPARPATCRIIGQTNGYAKPEVPSGQTRAFEMNYVEFKNMPKEIIRNCAPASPCNPSRIFEWNVTAIRAGH
jgi:hypothetical protein